MMAGRTGPEKGFSTSGRARHVPSLSPGASIQAVTKEGSVRGLLQPLQIPHLRERKIHCPAELCVLLHAHKAGGANKVQHQLNLLPGFAIDLGESLHPLCFHLVLAVMFVVTHHFCPQTEIFHACTSVILGSIHSF